MDIEKLLKSMIRNKHKPDMHSFNAKINNGSVYVEFANEKFYITCFVSMDSGQEVKTIACGDIHECHDKLVELGVKPETVDM